MLQDVFSSSQQISLEEISSPLSAHLFDLCDPELFQEPVVLQNSEVTSSPNNCGYEDNSYNTTNLTFPPDIFNNNHHPQENTTNTTTDAAANSIATANSPAATTTSTTITSNNNNNNNNNNSINNNSLALIFESQEEDIQNEISGAIDFTQTTSFPINNFLPNPQDSFDLSSLQPQAPSDYNNNFCSDPLGPLMSLQLPSCVYDDDCLPLLPPYMRMTTTETATAASAPTSCSFLDTTTTMGSFLPNTLITALGGGDNCGMFTGGTMFNMGGGCNELQTQDLDFQGDNGGIFCPEPAPRIYNSTELQAISSNESNQQQTANGGTSTGLASEISSLDDSTFKVGKISVEQRKEKISRYMKKRKERNFSKKIKYACRKTLADSRPRVRGRFAKNDEFSEMPRTSCNNHEEDTDDEVVVKEEEDMVDSSDILAHISGVNSFKCNYSIQSWI